MYEDLFNKIVPCSSVVIITLITGNDHLYLSPCREIICLVKDSLSLSMVTWSKLVALGYVGDS